MCGLLDLYLHRFATLETDRDPSRWTAATRFRSPGQPLLLLSVLDEFAATVQHRNCIEPSAARARTFAGYLFLLPGPATAGSMAVPFVRPGRRLLAPGRTSGRRAAAGAARRFTRTAASSVSWRAFRPGPVPPAAHGRIPGKAANRADHGLLCPGPLGGDHPAGAGPAEPGRHRACPSGGRAKKPAVTPAVKVLSC